MLDEGCMSTKFYAWEDRYDGLNVVMKCLIYKWRFEIFEYHTLIYSIDLEHWYDL
jgi:hypothetical protein